jgi:hypothetical protein
MVNPFLHLITEPPGLRRLVSQIVIVMLSVACDLIKGNEPALAVRQMTLSWIPGERKVVTRNPVPKTADHSLVMRNLVLRNAAHGIPVISQVQPGRFLFLIHGDHG